MEDVLVEDLHRELEKALETVDDIAEKVQRKELSAFDGFMQTEEYRQKANDIVRQLQELGIDITQIKL